MKWEKRSTFNTIEEVVLNNSGLTKEEFFVDENKKYRIDNLKEVAELITDCVNKKLKITIIGDYDADGINASAIMKMAIDSIGGQVTVRLPKRFSEGFGLSEKIVDEIDSGLLITVDNGIAAIDAVKKAKDKGLIVIVTDHHLPNEDENGNKMIPDADIVIDPNAIDNSADFNGYCGAGIAYKIAEELIPDNKVLLSKLICLY